jgi:hypothetical protein
VRQTGLLLGTSTRHATGRFSRRRRAVSGDGDIYIRAFDGESFQTPALVQV